MTTPPPSRRRPLAGLLLLAALGGIVLAVASREGAVGALEGASELGFPGALLVASLYLLTGLLGGPGTPIALATAFLFGFGPALAALIPMANAGGLLPFLLGRSLFAGWVEGWVARHRRLRAMRAALALRPVAMVILLRLSPVVPFSFVNYVASISPIRLRDYALGTFLGTLPVLVLNAWIGASLSTLGQALAGETEESPVHLALVALGLAASLAAAVLFTRNARRAVARLSG